MAPEGDARCEIKNKRAPRLMDRQIRVGFIAASGRVANDCRKLLTGLRRMRMGRRILNPSDKAAKRSSRAQIQRRHSCRIIMDLWRKVRRWKQKAHFYASLKDLTRRSFVTWSPEIKSGAAKSKHVPKRAHVIFYSQRQENLRRITEEHTEHKQGGRLLPRLCPFGSFPLALRRTSKNLRGEIYLLALSIRKR